MLTAAREAVVAARGERGTDPTIVDGLLRKLDGARRDPPRAEAAARSRPNQSAKTVVQSSLMLATVQPSVFARSSAFSAPAT